MNDYEYSVYLNMHGLMVDEYGAEYVLMRGYECGLKRTADCCFWSTGASLHGGRSRPACPHCGRDARPTGDTWRAFTPQGEEIRETLANAARRLGASVGDTVEYTLRGAGRIGRVTHVTSYELTVQPLESKSGAYLPLTIEIQALRRVCAEQLALI